MPSETILLFAGQGSRVIFSAAHSNALLDRVLQDDLASSLLNDCHRAFMHDVSSLSTKEAQIFPPKALESLAIPEDLVKPSTALLDNPVVQATTFFLHQILEYVLQVADEESSLGSETIAETTGFCSGIMTAIIVATNPTLRSPWFSRHAVGTFRVVFWTALRSAIYSESIAGSTWRDLPWSLVVSGLARSDLEALLKASEHDVSLSLRHIWSMQWQ